MFETLEQTRERIKQERKHDAEYLKELLKRTSKQVDIMSPNIWYASGDTLISVATILEGECLFTAGDAIRFFEKPWHFEKDMRDFVEMVESEA